MFDRFACRVAAIEALMAEGRKTEVKFPQQEGSHPSQA